MRSAAMMAERAPVTSSAGGVSLPPSPHSPPGLGGRQGPSSGVRGLHRPPPDPLTGGKPPPPPQPVKVLEDEFEFDFPSSSFRGKGCSLPSFLRYGQPSPPPLPQAHPPPASPPHPRSRESPPPSPPPPPPPPRSRKSSQSSQCSTNFVPAPSSRRETPPPSPSARGAGGLTSFVHRPPPSPSLPSEGSPPPPPPRSPLYGGQRATAPDVRVTEGSRCSLSISLSASSKGEKPPGIELSTRRSATAFFEDLARRDTGRKKSTDPLNSRADCREEDCYAVVRRFDRKGCEANPLSPTRMSSLSGDREREDDFRLRSKASLAPSSEWTPCGINPQHARTSSLSTEGKPKQQEDFPTAEKASPTVSLCRKRSDADPSTPRLTPLPPDVSGESGDPRFSPRVMVDVDLSRFCPLRTGQVDTAAVVSNFLLTRAPHGHSETDHSGSEGGGEREGEGDARTRMDSTSTAGGSEARSTQRQLPDYVSWVNSQLRKLPGTRPVEDLRNDMRDGVALVCLIQVIGREKLTGVHMVPCNNTEMLENVERVLHFMTSNHIRMHHIAAKDIVNGNLKAIMRCILALAAHFKPNSVKHSQYSLRSPSKNQNVTSIAQGAAAALTDVRRNVARAGHRSRRNRDAAFNERREYYAGDGSSPSRTPPPPSPTCYYLSRQLGSSSDPCSGDSDHSLGRCSGQLWPRADHGQLDSGRAGAACGPNPHPGHRGDRMTASLTAGQFQTSSSMTSDKPVGKDSGAELEDVVDKEMYEELLLEYGDLYDAMNDTKKQLILLQDLLLNGQIPDIPDMEDELPFEGSTPSEQLVVMKSRLQNSTEVCNDLRDRLSLTSAECMELRGKTAGQQSRLTEQDTVLVQLKNDLLHRDFDLEKVRVENRDLQATVESLQAQLQALQIQMREKETTSRALRSEIADLHHRLQQVGETGEMLTARIATQDRRMAQLAGRMSSSAASTASSENGRDTPMSSRSSLNNSTAQGGPESLNMVRECLATLRRHFQPAEPLRHTVDSLEQSVAALLEQAYSGALASPPHASQTSLTQVTFDSALLTTRHELDSTGAINSTMMNGQASTRVLYFTDKSVTPFMCTIHKRLGEIRLRDFKELFEHHGRYRFHFKALDPEYGTVKEEICNNDDLIPGWEGKIVAWVEEDNGTPC